MAASSRRVTFASTCVVDPLDGGGIIAQLVPLPLCFPFLVWRYSAPHLC